MSLVCFVRIAGAALVALVVCACETLPEGPFPRATEAGWWNDEGASGPARIIVHIGEQKAYFYKGKRLVGESTVSTGKPGFSTPHGSYSVLSKSPDHVSTIFGDYVDDYGNVVRSNIDARKDWRPRGSHFDVRPNAIRHVLQRRVRHASGIRTTLCCFPRLHSLAEGNCENILRECPRRHTSESNRVAQTSESFVDDNW